MAAFHGFGSRHCYDEVEGRFSSFLARRNNAVVAHKDNLFHAVLILQLRDLAGTVGAS
jgi:hypothetical protein